MSTPLYGRKLEDYSVSELKLLLKKEEERLSKVKRQIANRQREKASGVKLTTDEEGVTRRVLTEKEKVELRKCFDKIDTNGDGNLNREELKELLIEQFFDMCSEKQVQKAYECLDINNDGKITFDEFLDWWATDSKKRDVTGLRTLKGKLMSGNSFLGARFCNSNINATSSEGDINEYRSQIAFGEFNEEKATEMKFQVLPCTEEEHLKSLTDVTSELHLWHTDQHMQCISVMNDKKCISASVQVVFEARSEESAAKVASSLDEVLFQIEKELAFANVSSNAHKEVLKSHGVDLECESPKELVIKYRELCAKAVKSQTEESDTDYELVLKVLKHLKPKLHYTGMLKVELCGKEIRIKVRAFIPNRLYDRYSSYTGLLSKGLKECFVNFGMGGELSKHLRDVIDNDARILDMFHWGVRANSSVKCSSHLLETIAPLLKTVTGSSKFDSMNFLMGALGGGWLCNSFNQKLVFRNLFTNIERVVDFLVADARCVFQSNAGEESGYEWGPEEDDHLDELASWAHFIVRGVQEKARISSSYFRKPLKDSLAEVKRIEKTLGKTRTQDLMEGLVDSDAKLVSIVGSCPLAKVEINFVGDVKPFVLFPTKEFLEKYNSKDGLPSGESPEFLAELKDRKDMLEDEAAIREVQKAFEPAMQHLEDTKGTAAMAGKEGLIFVSGVLNMLTKKTDHLSFIFGKDDDGGVLRNRTKGAVDTDDSDDSESSTSLCESCSS